MIMHTVVTLLLGGLQGSQLTFTDISTDVAFLEISSGTVPIDQRQARSTSPRVLLLSLHLWRLPDCSDASSGAAIDCDHAVLVRM